MGELDINNYEKNEISSHKQDKFEKPSLASEKNQARDSSQIGLSNTNIKKNKMGSNRMKPTLTVDYDNCKKQKYLNIIKKNKEANVALRVKHQPNKHGLRRLPGSSPGRVSTPALFSNLNFGGIK